MTITCRIVPVHLLECEMNACVFDNHSLEASVMRVRVYAAAHAHPTHASGRNAPTLSEPWLSRAPLCEFRSWTWRKARIWFPAATTTTDYDNPPRTPKQHIKMADRGGFASRGGAERGGDRGRGRGGRRGPRRGAKSEEKEWQPVTKLGRLVKAGKIKSMEEIYLHSLPIKEYQIVDFFLPALKDEVMKVRHSRKKPGRNANGRT